jgi:serine/threonine protein kinase
MIHGDIKPENVLIFKDDSGSFTARVTDFGYSTRFANEDDLISVPRSWPWHAPEHDRDRYKPMHARKMDVFSFGMLCLWVLFEEYLSGFTPLPKDAHWAEEYLIRKQERNLSQRVLDNLKQKDKLVLLVGQLVTAERDLDSDMKQALKRFFSASLTCDPNQREADLKQSFSCVMPNK